MAQVRLLKIASDGVALEMDTAADDITLNSFSVQGGGPVLSATGLDMNNQDVSDVNDLSFNNPSTGTIGQTVGALIVDNIMGKDRENTMTTAGGISFPVITNAVGEVDSFRLPSLAGTPTVTPTTAGEGHMLWDSTNDRLMVWNGSSWVDASSSGTSAEVMNSYTASESIALSDIVYISAANTVTRASASSVATSYAIGFANAAAAAAASVPVKTDGIIAGFTGLTSGARQYLSTTPGGRTETVPVGAGNTVVQVGYAKNPTSIQIQLLQLGRRAS